ncbi:hypothetical protein B0H14DRAFT_3554324 [Mycena olivaceomarginata]|nr:hypothetical protein B0H14DRAFT_3554324 [Mycena olivaceomarginata]
MIVKFMHLKMCFSRAVNGEIQATVTLKVRGFCDHSAYVKTMYTCEYFKLTLPNAKFNCPPDISHEPKFIRKAILTEAATRSGPDYSTLAVCPCYTTGSSLWLSLIAINPQYAARHDTSDPTGSSGGASAAGPPNTAFGSGSQSQTPATESGAAGQRDSSTMDGSSAGVLSGTSVTSQSVATFNSGHSSQVTASIAGLSSVSPTVSTSLESTPSISVTQTTPFSPLTSSIVVA